ncbi:P-loop containing nucleoside triphosphate hydrolase [Kalmanozyma brasiliensis GHG001]|uniref:P-loop containing nucleoside triphosphate hydrolase protein n=1 Tax=Kalmanozyma brasiliensis (strain GHG001) TaxID=1365824 RepID=V5EWM5_KALBG|nr:P-loop containing nucleoside triphosphate hydrolase [Kalmanozyma brasiliensis GHG001]EST07773.1 P-loop containing nucleoside triphosphate hydrolase [Kalmanozyma brasiliensis GHG001]
MSQAPLQAVEVFGAHILQQLPRFRSKFSGVPAYPPLFVAMQGPQGSGKTTVTRSLVAYLQTAGLTVGVLSTDDLYHTHANLRKVAEESPDNPLLAGRGQPGTHDVALGCRILASIYVINATKRHVELPVFDKSLFDGQGDRAPGRTGAILEGDPAPTGPSLKAPLDVFILEGWSMGFSPIPPEEVTSKRDASPSDSPLRKYTVEALHQINRNLEAYTEWYRNFSVFLQIRPTNLDNVYIWRTQQEHAMKASNGGIGMTDDGVKAFVDRYMPGYHLFLDTIQQNWRWKGKSKSITIDLERRIVDVSDF